MPRNPPQEPRSAYFRRVIRITGQDSPNVRLAEAELAAGKEPSHLDVVPGVLSYAEYAKRRATWTPERQCVGLDAMFWAGPNVLMFPPEWLARAVTRAREVDARGERAGRHGGGVRGMGVDPAEGGDDCVWTVADELGVVEQVAVKTPDTSVIVPRTVSLMREHDVDPSRVCFDRGGGGKEHADILRAKGYPVRDVAFGEVLAPPPRPGFKDFPERQETIAEKYVYKNRRAQLYHDLRLRLDPSLNPRGWGVPGRLTELLRQLGPIPLTYDAEGRLYLVPKKHPPGTTNKRQKSLTELLGCSPDEADSATLALHAVLYEGVEVTAGGGW